MYRSWREQGKSEKIEMLDTLKRLKFCGIRMKPLRNFNEEDECGDAKPTWEVDVETCSSISEFPSR